MNKKGVTLIEMLAVITIIAILTMLIAPNIVSTRNSMLKSTLDSVISEINSAAKDYASDHIMSVPSKFSDSSLNYNNVDLCLYTKSHSNECVAADGSIKDCSYCRNYCDIVLVRTLMENGYLKGNDKTREIMEHPLTHESLNNEQICVMYNSSDAKNRKIVSYIIDEGALYDDFE